MIPLTFEDGALRLGDEDVPGILRSLSVRGQIKYDDSKLDAKSGRAKIPVGWDDADITATLDLLTDELSDCYDKLKDLDAIFRFADESRETEHKQTITRPPKIYTVVNRHINARGVKKVVFSGLASSETDDDDVIQAVLVFAESGNHAAKAEKRAQGKTDTKADTKNTSSSAQAKTAVTKDDEKPIKGKI